MTIHIDLTTWAEKKHHPGEISRFESLRADTVAEVVGAKTTKHRKSM
jgi:hypothetical protein